MRENETVLFNQHKYWDDFEWSANTSVINNCSVLAIVVVECLGKLK
jgi:hypothetical protein